MEKSFDIRHLIKGLRTITEDFNIITSHDQHAILTTILSSYSKFGCDIKPHRGPVRWYDGGCRWQKTAAAVHRAAQPGGLARHCLLGNLHLLVHWKVHHRIYHR